MLSPRIAKQIDRVVAAHAKGFLNLAEAGFQLGQFLFTADNLGEMLERIPTELRGHLKEGIVFASQQAADDECLRPEKSPFDLPAISVEYYRTVAALLLQTSKPSRRQQLNVICLPSFQPEWALQLFQSKRKEYTLVLTVAEEQIWSSGKKMANPVKRTEAEISLEMAETIREIWVKMLSRVRHPNAREVAVDGVQYHFSLYRQSGTTWSPDSETAPGKMVALSELLYRYVEADETVREGLIDGLHSAATTFRDSIGR